MSQSFRPASPGDFEAIADLTTRVFRLSPDNPFRDRAYQHWKYWRQHPDWGGSRSYVIELGGRIVAHGCTWPMRLLSAAREWKGQFLIDWVADPETPGAGISLLKRTANLVDGVCAIGGSEMTRAILPKFGFRPYNEAWFFARPLRPFLQTRTHQFNNWKLPLRWARNTWWRWWPPLPPGREWRAIEQAPGALGEHLWPKPSPDSLIGVRHAALFEYLLACPAVKFRFYQLARQDRPCGYCCLSLVHHQVRIADLWVESKEEDDWKAAYRAAFEAALLDPEAAEVITMSSMPLARKALLGCGFRLLDKIPIAFFGTKEFLAAGTAFHLQMIDSDFSSMHGTGPEYRT
ncbi:MAG: hypothetical protein HY235_09895 [Acidobacteria bacterium]|nr:hypothetical protein [Acidobacteriota bacterium]